LSKHKDALHNIDVLVAPYHGRDSDRDWGFLDWLNPALTLFGNAPSEHLAYGQFRQRGLPIITNNQANCIIINAGADPMQVYSTNETYARNSNNNMSSYNAVYKAYYCGNISRKS
jgi:competence protein ComEC